MEYLNIDGAMREKLKAPLPPEALKPHPTKTFLTSIKPIFITERLNDVFGIGSWKTSVQHVTTTDKLMVVVKVVFEIPEFGVYHECFGGNDNGGENSKNFDLGDAFKGATTDAITKIASYLEIGIDVFKGKSDPQQKSDEPSKPWLNEKDFNAALARINKGEQNVVMKLLDHFIMKKTYRETLESAEKNYKPIK